MISSHKTLAKLLVSVVSLVLSLLVIEFVLRHHKYQPLPDNVTANEVQMHQPDSALGWLPKPGVYKIKPYDPREQGTTVTFWPNGARATAPQPNSKVRRIILIGCSFTMGWAITDEDTFAWKLQSRYPDIEVVNLGCDGYGTYQSLLRLEHYFESEDARGHTHLAVIYGFMDHHPVRNVASADWLELLGMYLHRGHTALPYCDYSQNTGTLVRMPPVSCPNWPLQYKSALVHRLLNLYLDITARERGKRRYEVTKLLLSELNRTCKEHGARLVVPVLQASGEPNGKLGGQCERDFWLGFLRETGIPTMDASDGIDMRRWSYRVLGEGHPNGRMNTIWAERLDRLLTESKIVPGNDVIKAWPAEPQS
jgi:hypothetical protein